MVEELMHRYPAAQMFVYPKTRAPLLFIGAGMIITAIVLLAPPGANARHQRPAGLGRTSSEDADGYLSQRGWNS